MRTRDWVVSSLAMLAGLGALAFGETSINVQTPALQMAAIAPFVPVDSVNTVLGDVDSRAYTVISDVYFDADTLTILTNNQPLAVKKAFLLPNPDRYVVDIDHAALSTKDLARIITQNHPDIQNIKVGQFDDKTVRVVVSLVSSTRPLDITQRESPKSLRLMFTSKPTPVATPISMK